MTRRNQIRLIFHGALFMVISMVVESPVGFIYALNHGTDDLIRQYLRQSHSVLMATGIWMIATAMTLPLLDFAGKFIAMLVWSLLISGYTFMLAIAVFIAGLWRYPPNPTKYPHQIDQLRALPHHLQWINISLLVVSGLTSLVAGWLLVKGSRNAMRESMLDRIH